MVEWGEGCALWAAEGAGAETEGAGRRVDVLRTNERFSYNGRFSMRPEPVMTDCLYRLHDPEPFPIREPDDDDSVPDVEDEDDEDDWEDDDEG